MVRFRKLLVIGLLMPIIGLCIISPEAKAQSLRTKYDLIVYGGTPSGVMAAVAAKRLGVSVLLISASETVGGAISNGLSHTDIKRPEIVGGIPEEYFDQARAASENGASYDVDSNTSERLFNQLLDKENIRILRNSPVAVAEVKARKINCLGFTTGARYCASQFIDASYEGDLLPLTNTAYNLGRRDLYSYQDYKELNPTFRARLVLPKKLSGSQRLSLSILPFMQHPTDFDVDKVDLTSGMPSMTYRFCLTKSKSKRQLNLAPEDKRYIPAWIAIVSASYRKPCTNCHSNGSHKATKFFTITRVAGRKWDLNSYNSFTNFPIPASYFSDPSTRLNTKRKASRYIESFVAFLQSRQNPIAVERKTLSGFGMCSDQWVENNNIPYEPYIREGRRLIGLSTLTANQELSGKFSSDSIGLAYYNTDSKLSLSIQYQNVLYRDYSDYRFTKVYQLPRSITLPKSGPTNLQVSVSVSASPLGFGSLRMEPHYMQLGQATGVAAALAVKEDTSVSEVNIRDIQLQLHRWGQPTLFAFSRFFRR